MLRRLPFVTRRIFIPYLRPNFPLPLIITRFQMFYSRLRRALLTVILLVGAGSAASAQVGIGFGLSAMGADVRRAVDDLRKLADGDSLSYSDVSGGLGAYGIFRA